jgi:hypothetical protein
MPAIASSDALPAVPRRRGWILALIALPVIGIAAYGGWLAIHDGEPPPAPPVEARAPSAPPAPAAPAAAAAPSATPPVGAAAPVAVAHIARVELRPVPPADTIHLHLTSTPGGATVDLDGKRLGATPLDVEVARLDGDAQLVISRDGFTDVKQRLDLRVDQSLSVALPPVPRPLRVIKRAAPPAERRDPRAGSAAPRAAGSAAPKGDPNLDIRLSR